MQSTKNSTLKFSGPIRWKGFIPIGVLVTGFVLYFLFLFDPHLKMLFETLGSRLNGAQVNIGSLKTSFTRCDFDLRKLEVANKNDLMKNFIEIDRIHFQFLFKPILSLKLIIEDMSVTGLHYGTDRTKSGLLPERPRTPPGKPGLFDKLTSSVYGRFKEELENSPLEGLRQFTTGINIENEIKNMGSDLGALKKIQELETQLDTSTTRWRENLNKLPNANTVNTYKDRVTKLSNVQANNPQAIIEAINSVNSLRTEIDRDTQSVQTVVTDTQSQVNSLATNIGTIDQAIDKDVNAIFQKLKLPKLDFNDLSTNIVGKRVLAYLEPVTRYIDLARRYMPKPSKDKEVIVQTRAKGVDVRFVSEKSYPKFLLKHASLSSDVSADPTQGSATGKLLGLTTDPPIYGKPTEGSISADFPKSQIRDARVGVVIDHTTDIYKESFQARVGSFPVTSWSFNDSDDLSLGIEKAFGRASFDVAFTDDSLNASLKAKIDNVQYRIKSSSRKIEEALQRILGTIPNFDLDGSLSGPMSDLKVSFRSSLGTRMAEGIQAEFKHQMAAFNDTIRKNVLAEVDQKKKELENRFAQTKDQILGPMQAKLTDFTNIQNLAQNTLKKLQDEQTNFAKKQVQQKAGQSLDQIKNKVKLPF